MCKISGMEGNQMLRIQVGIWAWRCIIVASGVPKKNTLRSKKPSILSAGWFIVCDKIMCVKRKMWINTVFGWQPITGCESKCLSELGSCIVEPCCNIILKKNEMLWKWKIRRCQCVIIPYIRSENPVFESIQVCMWNVFKVNHSCLWCIHTTKMRYYLILLDINYVKNHMNV